jgi:hypothetical protein
VARSVTVRISGAIVAGGADAAALRRQSIQITAQN